MANDAHEEFWGCTLTKDKKEYTWDPTADSEEDIEHKLQVTSACLGYKVKDGERNLVEVTTEVSDGKKITCSLVSLRAGGRDCMHLEMGFNNKTKFTLKEGNGPLSLSGVHLQALPLDFDEDNDSEGSEDIPDLVQEPPKDNKKKEQVKKEKVEEKKGIKRPLPVEKNGKKEDSKKKKPEPVKQKESEDGSSDEDEEDMDSEDEEESDDEEMPSLLDGEADEDTDDEDSEEDDEPEDGDDIESDDEDEDDEEDSEEEKPVTKQIKKLTNGHTPKSPKGKQEQKQSQKTPAKKTPGIKENTTNTPKSAGPKKTPDEIKAMLLKSPNLPKKFEKFSNYMKNNMKITDAKSQKEFWDYVQKNKK